MSKAICDCRVIETARLAPDVYSIRIETKEISKEAKAGQFVSLYCHDGGHLMPRPISICEIDKDAGRLRLVYRVVGYGTAELSLMTPGSKVRVMGPLGNGFPLEENKNLKNVILIGGGIGIPPMLCVAKAIKKQDASVQVTAVIGYRDRHDFLSDDLYEVTDNLIIATDDGSRGTHGTVIDAMDENDVLGDVIYSCGPTPMLRGVKTWGEQRGIPVWLSLEERMACGIGACLGCVCKSTEVDEHSQVKNKRVCKDGPVFPASEVDI